ncbi:MAG: DNA polymerase III subunit alpha, partial [Limnobacter sp.]|nr:DNA polymerase III subunit alpha [Limnobacter sp.]
IQFLKQEDFRAHEARVCIANGEILSNPRRVKRFTEQQYFKSTEEMLELFADIPGAVQNTLRVAMRCNLELELGKPKLPDFPTPDGMTLDDFLVHLSKEGLEKRLVHLYPDESEREAERPKYEERLKIECDTIIGMGFPGYFLIVQDFINWGKKNGVPVGPGRGSGAGSLVAYALGITDIDPLRYDLLFERFLNPERVSMPDFDIDFCQDNRDRVIDYVKQRYGREAVSQIATFGTLGAKAVIRDAGRVLDMPYNYCDGLSKLIPATPADPWSLDRAMAEEPSFKERVENEEEAKEIINVAKPLEGLTRNVGMHAGGVLIAPGKLTDFTPLYCAEGTESVVSQYDKDDVEAVGLVKFDFLGLRNLTILDWAVRWVREGYEDMRDFQLEDLKLDDPEVYRLFCDGNTTAVFQSESRSAKDLEKKLKPDNFEDIIALMALNRPGPLGSGMVDDFIARKKEQSQTGQGKKEWYFHDNLVDTLKSTYGVIVYQEQVMLVAQLLAGYSLGGADLLRRAMGKKKAEEMAKQREIFTKG